MVGKRQHRAIVKFWLGTGSDGGGTIKRGEHSDPGIYIHFLTNLYWPFHRGLRGWLKKGGGVSWDNTAHFENSFFFICIHLFGSADYVLLFKGGSKIYREFNLVVYI